MDHHSSIWREIVAIEADLADPHSANRKAKKARLEELRGNYRYALGQEDHDRGEPCPVHVPERAAGWRNAAGKALLKRPTETGYPRVYGDWHPGDEM